MSTSDSWFVKVDVFSKHLHRSFDGCQKKLCASSTVKKTVCSRASNGGPISHRNLHLLTKAFGLSDVSELGEKRRAPSPANKLSTCDSTNDDRGSELRIAPTYPSLLVGREDDLGELRRRIKNGLPSDSDRPVQVIVPIRGLPGVGKTALVSSLWYQNEVQSQFSQTLYASVGSVPPNRLRARLSDILRAWGHALNLPAVKSAESLTLASDLLRLHFANESILIVLDDLWDRDAARQLMIGGGKSATLITTRDNQVARQLAPACGDIYTLNCLSRDASLELLSRLAAPVVSEYSEACSRLLDRLYGLPFAIQLVGRDLNTAFERNDDIPEIINSILGLGDLLEREAPPDMLPVIEESSSTVAAILSHSTSRLSEVDLKRFAVLGGLPAEPATFTRQLLQAVWECSADDVAATVQNLEGRGLIECSHPQNYQLHSLMKGFAHSLLQRQKLGACP